MVSHSLKTALTKADEVPAQRELRLRGWKGDEAAEEVSQNLRSPWLPSQSGLRRVCCCRRLSRSRAPFLGPSPLPPRPPVSDARLGLCPGVTQAAGIEAGSRTPACRWWGKLTLSLHVTVCASKFFGGVLSWNPKDGSEVGLPFIFFFSFQLIPTILTTRLRICAACAPLPAPGAHGNAPFTLKSTQRGLAWP